MPRPAAVIGKGRSEWPARRPINSALARASYVFEGHVVLRGNRRKAKRADRMASRRTSRECRRAILDQTAATHRDAARQVPVKPELRIASVRSHVAFEPFEHGCLLPYHALQHRSHNDIYPSVRGRPGGPLPSTLNRFSNLSFA